MNKQLINEFVNVVVEIEKCEHNEKTKEDLIEKILLFLKKNIDLDGVGIRIKESYDYPYYTTLGFSDYFVKAENFLCKTDKDGKVERKADGTPILECLCGKVIDRELDKNLPCCTPNGSYFSTGIKDEIKEIEKTKCIIRGRCSLEGYKSVVLIPILYNNKSIGLIQLNSLKEKAFCLDVVETVEEIAKIIGEAIGPIMLDEHKREEKRKILSDNIKKITLGLQAYSRDLLKKYGS